MKNNKGFTVVEMGVSFCLIFTICLLLFQIIMSVKDIYVKSDIETTLLSKQGILLNKIYKDFEDKGGVKTFSASTTNNITTATFTLGDDTTTTLTIDKENKKITYGNYLWDLSGDINTIGDTTITNSTEIGGNNYFDLSFRITNNLTKNTNYGLNIFYKLNS